MHKGKLTKDEDEEEANIYQNLDTITTLREAQMFNDREIQSDRCIKTLTKILYLIRRGEKFSSEDATRVFFSVTKLFQSRDAHLRRMVYLFIKEMQVDSDEGLIVVSCLQKDMTSTTDLFRANAIRVLAKIMDASMVVGIERFLKQAIVDKNPFIVSSTLIAGMHIFDTPGGSDIIKRWTNQIQDSLSNPNKMVQYQALSLLYKIKEHDQLSLTKVVSGLSRNPPKGPHAQCLLISIIGDILQGSNNTNSELMKFLTNCLHNKNSMVMYEAARTLCNLPGLSQALVTPAISVLQEFLSSSIPVQRFAAVKTLSQVVVLFPLIVTPCSSELERLITDSNRNIATLAITTLLKTGMESSVDRLLKNITGFMSDISDEFKVVLVDAIKTLCLKFPHKYQTLTNFLASALRDEGGFKYKKAIVDALLTIIDEIKDAKEIGLEHCCEFIEDCEFAELSIKILQLLGEKGPKTTNPAKYIRFIFNRIILETASVRSAAVSSLAKFGAGVPALTENVIVLLKRCLNDNDDEVRDRAIFYLNLLDSEVNKHRCKALLFHNPLDAFPLATLELSLQVYMENVSEEPFNLTKHIVESEEKELHMGDEENDDKLIRNHLGSKNNPHLEILNSIPELAMLGSVLKSCEPIELTESETEYVVNCVKHIYKEHVVFQFNVTNNMEDQLLENVTVEMEIEQPDSDDKIWEEDMIIPETSLTYQVGGACFVCFTRPEGVFTSGNITNTMKFFFKDVDSLTGEISDVAIEDEYQLEDIEVTEADFMKPDGSIGLVEFREQWDGIKANNSDDPDITYEVVKKYTLGLDNLQAAVDAVVELTGMAACESSGIVPDSARSHAVNLHGIFHGNIHAFCRTAFMLVDGKGVSLKIACRSEDSMVNHLIASAIR